MDEAAALFFRDQLRSARYVALRNAEEFHHLIYGIERLGRMLSPGHVRGLADLRPCIVDLVSRQNTEDSESLTTTVEQLFDMVRTARNDALHQGAFARHLTRNATLLAIALEDALMETFNEARHFMIANPMMAELWQTIDIARQAMLANSFSYLPIRDPERRWRLLSDEAMARFSRVGSGTERKRRLSTPIRDAISNGLHLQEALCFGPHDGIDRILTSVPGGRLVLIVRDSAEQELLGVLSPFDLL